ncbi:MAG TPA: DUF6171 family protein [Lachnospiraceae bacterium]|nr:DUF6171 family protein [Lachnospiraceae bacterium]
MQGTGCRKCLFDQIDQNSYIKSIQNRIDSLDDEIRTVSKVYEKRLAVCGTCRYLKDDFCGACGCFVKLKAAIAVNRCPYEKWKE